MKCRAIQKAVSEQPAGRSLAPSMREHVRTCSQCQRFVAAMQVPASSASPSPELLARVAGLMSSDLRAVKPLASRAIYGSLISAVLLFVFGVAAYRMPAHGWDKMGAFETALVLAALGSCGAACVSSLVNQMTPAGRYKVWPEMLPVLVIGVLAFGTAALFHFEHEVGFWASSWVCLRIGLTIAIPTAAIVWVILWRGVILSPGLTGATAGVVAGVAGAGALEVHCPNLNAWHILASHLGVAVCAGLLGLLAGAVTGGRGAYRK
ncbi:MAG: NrsF family protein [Bryobacteraceae bacterium]